MHIPQGIPSSGGAAGGEGFHNQPGKTPGSSGCWNWAGERENRPKYPSVPAWWEFRKGMVELALEGFQGMGTKQQEVKSSSGIRMRQSWIQMDFPRETNKGIPHLPAISELTINPTGHHGDDPSIHPSLDLFRWKIPFYGVMDAPVWISFHSSPKSTFPGANTPREGTSGALAVEMPPPALVTGEDGWGQGNEHPRNGWDGKRSRKGGI